MSVADPRERFGYLSSDGLRGWLARYGFTVLAVAVATGLQLVLPWLGPFHLAFILYYPAVVMVAMWAGFWPGIVATLLSAAAGAYFFLDPRNTFAIRTTKDVVGPMLFVLNSVALTFLVQSRDRAKKALRVSDADLNRAQAVAQIGSWRYDVEQKALRLSDEACRIVGFAPNVNLSVQQAQSMVYPEDQERLLRAWETFLAGGAYDEQSRVVFEGGTRWVRIQGDLERDPAGRPAKAVGTVQDITDHKLAQDRVEEFERAVEGLEEMIVVVDRDYRYVIANQAYLKHRGMRKEDVLGRLVSDVVEPEVFESTVRGHLEECFRGEIVQFDLQYAYPALGERDLVISCYPIEGAAGVDRVVSVMRDVTETKKAGWALRASEDRYRDLVDHSEDLVCTHDLQGRLLSVNPAPARILGYEVEELLKIPMRDLIIPEGRELFDQYLERLRTTGQPERGLLCVMTRTGEVRTWEYQNTLRSDGVATPVVRGMAHDVTEKRRAELALQDAKDFSDNLIQTANVMILGLDTDGNVNLLNGAGEEITGYTFAELKGKSWSVLVPRDRFPEVWREFDGIIDGTAGKTHENPILTKTGEERYIAWQNSTLKINGRVVATISFGSDITEHKQAEEALRSSEQGYRMLFEKNIAGVAIASLEGKLLDCNDAWAWTLGYESAAEIRERQTTEFYFELTGQKPLIQELEQTGALLSREMKLRRKDGSAVWVLYNCMVRRGEGGEPFLQTTAIDITERKQAEEFVRQSEERFRIALKGSPITVFSQDRDLRYTWIYNPQLYWQQDVVGKTDHEIIGLQKIAQLQEFKRRVLETGIAVREEIVIPHNSKKYSFDITIEPLFDADKNVIGITGVAMDIARLRELADRLQETKEKLVQEKSYLENEIETELGFETIIGESSALRDVQKNARVVAPTDSTVLLLGETGTGKELIARSVHALSSRRERSFIKLNCAAVPSGLLESELFGHEKGAFTGAVSQKMGRVELADKGTLFLDEIGELPLDLQPKLLRLLQDREFERLGGVRTLKVDVRIISATNRDLQRDVAAKKFREDLFYRLNVFPIQMPALRERRGDIPLLVQHFVRKHAVRMGKRIETIPGETMDALQKWNWPGNIRELENMIERMVILTKGSVLAPAPEDLSTPQEAADDDLTEMEREHIMRVLRETNGVLAGPDGASSRLGIKRTTLQSMLKRLGIEPQEFRQGTGTFGPE